LNTPYDDVVQRCAQLNNSVRKKGHPVRFIVDTGGNRAAIDPFRVRNLSIIALQITGGTGGRSRIKGSSAYVSKQELTTTLQNVSNASHPKLHLPFAGKWARALREELSNFEIRLSESGAPRFGAFAYGKKDDMILAVSYACWYAERIGGGYKRKITWF
jgi:hypothetical protein